MIDLVPPQNSKEHREMLDLLRENNRMLKKIRRATVFSNVMRGIYWLIILGVGFGAYYYLQPYLEGLFETYKAIMGTATLLQGGGLFGGGQ